MGNWNLIYATDSSGNPTSGSLSQLRNAVAAGADVKVLYSPAQNIWWSRYCASVTYFKQGGNDVVSAIFMEAADTTQTVNGLDFETPFALEYQIYNSLGTRVLWKFDYETQTLRTSESDRIMPMRWYVKDYYVSFWRIIADLGASLIGR